MNFDLLPLKTNQENMKRLNFVLIFSAFVFTFTHCSTAQKLQKKAPITLAEVYCQSWVSGVKGGGSGLNLFIPVSQEIPQNIRLDSAYFRGKVTKLELAGTNLNLYVARFEENFNQKQDIVMSNDPKEEYGNQFPILTEKIPFDLKDTESVISYTESNVTKYFKIENIAIKKQDHYPSAPTNKQ